MKIPLAVLTVFLFIGAASASTEIFGHAGMGLSNGVSIASSPASYFEALGQYSCLDGHPSVMYIQIEHGGNHTFQLDLELSGPYASGGGTTLYVYGLNYTSGGSPVWTTYLSVSGGSSIARTTYNFSAYSNVGIYEIYGCFNVGGGTTGIGMWLYPETSNYELVGDPDLSARTYAIGSYVTVPLLNKYYPQITTVSGYDSEDLLTGLGNNNTAQSYYLAPLFMSCSLAEGIQGAYVKNANGTAPYQNWQAYYFNFYASARQNINFIYASDQNGSNLYIPAGGSHTFVIGVNNSESLSGVGWYVSRQFLDGSFGSSYPVIPTTDKNMSYTYAPPDNYGRYRVEAQIEDTYCVPHRFVTYTWYVTLGSSVSLSGYVSTGIMNTPVANASVELECPSGEANRTTLTDANGAYSFTGLGAGQYTLNIVKSGYSCSACPDTFTLNATVDGNNPYNRDYVLVVGSVTTTTLASTDSLRLLNVSDFTIGDVFAVWASYKSNGLTISDATCTFTGANFDPSSGSLESPNYEKIVQIIDPAGASSYSVTCSKTGHQTLIASDSFTVHDATDIATEISWISDPLEAVVGVFALYRIKFRTSSLTGVSGAACSLYVNGAEYVMSDQDNGYYSRSYVYSSTGVYKVYALCSKANYQDGQTENITTVVSQTTTTTVPHTCSDGIKNNDETDRDCGGSCDPCEASKACKKNADCLSNWCSSLICKTSSCTDLTKNGDETGIDCGGTCGPCGCVYISQCAQDGSEHCENNVCVKDYC